MDLSYNNFNGSATPDNCHYGNMNFVSSYSSTNSTSILPCLRRNHPCSENPNFKLFINCGGSKVTIEGMEYEADIKSPLGAAMHAESDSRKWAYSSTGSFVDRDRQAKYIALNTSILNISNPQLYTSARVSPLSLKYYGLYLQKGNYTVSLHFAEIIFTDDQTFSSNGRRVFDVFIQAYVLEEEGRMLELVDSNLGSNYSKVEALQILNLALICTDQSPALRPPMSMVVSMLEGEIPVHAPSRNPATSNEGIRFNSFESISRDGHTHSISIDDGSWSESSISVQSRQREALHSSSSKLDNVHTELSITERQE